jgi:hypothetical protein
MKAFYQGGMNRKRADGRLTVNIQLGAREMTEKAKLINAAKQHDAREAARAIHHTLKYMSQDALELGMNQTANLLEMVAHLALDEAKSITTRH